MDFPDLNIIGNIWGNVSTELKNNMKNKEQFVFLSFLYRIPTFHICNIH